MLIYLLCYARPQFLEDCAMRCYRSPQRTSASYRRLFCSFLHTNSMIQYETGNLVNSPGEVNSGFTSHGEFIHSTYLLSNEFTLRLSDLSKCPLSETEIKLIFTPLRHLTKFFPLAITKTINSSRPEIIVAYVMRCLP